MLSRAAIEALIPRLTFKPGYTFEVHDTPFQGPYFTIHVDVEDAYNPGQTVPLHIRSPLPPACDEACFLTWLRWRLERVEVHEVHEFLRLDGRILYDPHGEGADQPA